MKKSRVAQIALALLFVLIGCGGGGGGSSASQSTAVLATNTKALDTATANNIASVSSDGTTLTFSGTTTQLDSLKTGDIIISGATDIAPKGLLRKVVSVSASGGSVQVVTAPASLTDAFEELHLQGTVASESSAGLLAKVLAKSFFIPKITFPIPNTEFTATGKFDTSLSGNFTFNPGLDYAIDISGHTLNKFRLVLSGSTTFDLDQNLTLFGAINYTPLEHALTTAPILIATIPTPVPLINLTLEFIPSVGVTLSAEGQLTANLGFKSANNMAAGIEYSKGSFLPVTSYDYSFDPYFNASSSTAVSAKPYFRAKIGFYVNDAIGPYFDLRPYGKVAQVISPAPHKEYSIGITGNAGGEVKFLTYTFAAINVELFDHNYVWIPDSVVTPPASPTNFSVTAASSSAINLSWNASSGNVTGYKVYKDGSYLNSVATTSYADTGLSPATNYCYYVTAYNSAGESTQTSQLCATTLSSTPTTYSISGGVTINGSGLKGVTITLTGAGATLTTTDSSGNYSFASVQNGSYTVTPSLTGYTFVPASQTVTINGADDNIPDFVASAVSDSGTNIVTEFSAGISTDSYLYGISAGPDGNLWFTGGYRIGRITPDGAVTEYGLTIGEASTDITVGPDGNIWFNRASTGMYSYYPDVGRINPLTGEIDEFSVPYSYYGNSGLTAGPDGNVWLGGYGGVMTITPAGVVNSFAISTSAKVNGITAGPDGNQWFIEENNYIGKITSTGVYTEFPNGLPINSVGTGSPCITTGPDGNIWFSSSENNLIGKITPSGTVTLFSNGISVGAKPTSVTTGPDGNLWFTEQGTDSIGRITPAGVVTEFSEGISSGASPIGIAAGPDGNIWFTEPGVNKIGRITLK